MLSTRLRRARAGVEAFAGALAAGPAPGEEIVFATEEQVAAMRTGGAAAQAGAAGAMPIAKAAPSQSSLGSEFDHAGRNDPCPCGSGKKFKFCHGR